MSTHGVCDFGSAARVVVAAMPLGSIFPFATVPGKGSSKAMYGPGSLHQRDVPFDVMLKVLFGGVLSQIGWILLAFSSIFFWAFAANADLSGLTRSITEYETADATVSQLKPTSFSEGKRSVYVYEFSLKTPGGEVVGRSYDVGDRAEVGKVVEVEYPKGKPELANIVGMRRRPFSASAIIAVIFPLIGLVILGFAVPYRLRGLRLLRSGLIANGTLTEKEPTQMTVNKQVVYRLSFEFQASDGKKYNTTVSTHDTARLEDEKLERLLYSPQEPGKAVLMDALPGQALITPQGRVVSNGGSLAVIIAPALTFIINLLCGYLFFK